jgi:hypothetical protein
MQHHHSDNNDILVGWGRMAAFAQNEGFKITKSTISKKGSPALGGGPELIGYFGHMPASTKGHIRAWLESQLQPEPPPSKRWAKRHVTTTTP